MSIENQADRIKSNIADAYAAAGELEASLPAVQNSDNLPAAIRSIPGARDALTYNKVVTLNVGNSFTTFVAALSGFNHVPKIDECFVAVMNMDDNGHMRSWLAYCDVVSVDGEVVTCSIESYTETTGETGASGKNYIICETTLGTNPETLGVGGTFVTLGAKFSSTPEVGDFVFFISKSGEHSYNFIGECTQVTTSRRIFTLVSYVETTGANGTAAGFGTPTATVGSGTGTPSVQVTASGPDTAKVFNFAFQNLKGAKGDTGAQGPGGKISSVVALSASATIDYANNIYGVKVTPGAYNPDDYIGYIATFTISGTVSGETKSSSVRVLIPNNIQSEFYDGVPCSICGRYSGGYGGLQPISAGLYGFMRSGRDFTILIFPLNPDPFGPSNLSVQYFNLYGLK